MRLGLCLSSNVTQSSSKSCTQKFQRQMFPILSRFHNCWTASHGRILPVKHTRPVTILAKNMKTISSFISKDKFERKCQRMYTSPTTRKGSAAIAAIGNAPVFVTPTVRAGRFELPLPLPNVTGLSLISMALDMKVKDLIAEVKSKDSSIHRIELLDHRGRLYAKSTLLEDLQAGRFTVLLDDISVGTLEGTLPEHIDFIRDEEGFRRLRNKLQTEPANKIPVEQYFQMCAAESAGEEKALAWLETLQQRGIILHFKESNHAELRNTLLLRPTGSGLVKSVERALDISDSILQDAYARTSAEIEVLSQKHAQLLTHQEAILQALQQRVRTRKYVVMAVLHAQFGVLAYLVWNVLSWDIMEPVTFFLGVTTAIGSAAYHAMTKKDPTYTNVFNVLSSKNFKEMCEHEKFDPADVQKIQSRLAEAKEELRLIAARLGDARMPVQKLVEARKASEDKFS